jgi:hypothetical protein
MTLLVIDILNLAPGSPLLTPVGITTRHDSVNSVLVEGARVVEILREPELCSGALLLEEERSSVRLIHRVSPAPHAAGYPESVFAGRWF